MEAEKEIFLFEKQDTATERPERKPRVETPEKPEKKKEEKRETAEAGGFVEKTASKGAEEKPSGQGRGSRGTVPPHPQADPVIMQKVEHALEDGIGPIFVKLRPEEQDMIKAEGERTAFQIAELIASAKATAVRIFKLIVRWLSLIPGISKWFIQQEAKIKTDQMMKIQK